MTEKNSRLFLCCFVILTLILVPILQTIPSNIIKPQIASATSGIILNNTATTGTVKLSPYQFIISNFTGGTGSNRLLVVGVSANQSVSSITFGGTSLTKKISHFANHDAEFWYLTNPSGVGNIVVTMAGPSSAVIGALEFSGVDQTTPIPTTNTNTGTNSNPTISLTTQNANSMVLDLPSIGGGVIIHFPTCTQQWSTGVLDIINTIAGASSGVVQTLPGSVTCSWTAYPNGSNWDDVAIEIKAALGSTIAQNSVATGGSVPASPYQTTLPNFNVGTGSNRLLVVGASSYGTDAWVKSITFGGIGLTRAAKNSSNNFASFWYLKNPNGTGNIVVTMNAPASIVVGAYDFFGVDQVNPIPTNATNSGTASSPSISLTTKYANSWVLDLPAIWGGKNLNSPTCSQNWNIDVRDYIVGQIDGASSSTIKSSPGSVTCGWTANPSGDNWADVAIEIKASTATLDSTSTSISLNPTTVNGGGQTTVTATVSDTTTPSNTPTGTVTFSSNGGGGTFSNSGSCTLSSGICSVTYTSPNTAGTVTISGSYGGDLTHSICSGSSTLTVKTTPGAPTSPTSTALNTTAVQLGWTAPSSNGGSPITGYKIQRTSTSWVTLVNNTGNVTSYTQGSLAPNSLQTYRIGAWNSIGLGAYSSNDTAVTIPGSPTSLTANAISSSKINLSWTAPSGNATISGYKIERSTNGGNTWSIIVANTGSTSTTYSDTGLSASTTYTYRVSAINAGGAGYPSTTASATTLSTSSSWHSSTGILEPLYISPYKTSCNSYPSNFCWNPINVTKNSYPHVPFFVIINPNSGFPDGCGASYVPDYQKGTANLTKSGVIVLGYVFTSYGTRSISTVENEINNYHSCMPNVTGIELDEFNGTTGNENYYSTLTTYIHVTEGMKYSFGNPGTDTGPSYHSTVDLLNVYEGSTLPSNSTLQGNNQWHTQYDKSGFRFEQYGVSNAPSQQLVQGKSIYGGYLFFTNGTSLNPWNVIPPYLSTLAGYLNNTSVLSGIYAEDMSSNPINARILMTQSGTQVRNSTTPFNYNETSTWQFVLNPQNSCPGHTFDHWLDTGSTIASRTIAPAVNTNYTAVYRTC